VSERWKRLKSWFNKRHEAYLEWSDGPDSKASLERLQSGIGLILVVTLIIVAIWALISFPSWYLSRSLGSKVFDDPVRAFELENESRKTLTQIILGIFGLLVLYFTWRRVKAGDKTAQVAEQGHITERYTKAIEQLGKLENGEPNIEVRLGAIYALERIAIDSPRDHQTIMEVLCAYVRRNAVPPPAPPTNEPAGGESPVDTPPAKDKPRIDIQAILTVVGRRQRGKRREKAPFRIDLSRTHLNGADLSGSHLEGAFLREAHLEGAGLVGAHLEGSNLIRARLLRAHLSGAYLEGACLVGARLWSVNLMCSHLKEADLGGAQMGRACLRLCDLEKANLGNACLEEADLVRSNLERASLSGAGLYDADLEGTIGLTVQQVKSANNWELAHYDPEFRRRLGLPDEQ